MQDFQEILDIVMKSPLAALAAGIYLLYEIKAVLNVWKTAYGEQHTEKVALGREILMEIRNLIIEIQRRA